MTDQGQDMIEMMVHDLADDRKKPSVVKKIVLFKDLSSHGQWTWPKFIALFGVIKHGLKNPKVLRLWWANHGAKWVVAIQKHSPMIQIDRKKQMLKGIFTPIEVETEAENAAQ